MSVCRFPLEECLIRQLPKEFVNLPTRVMCCHAVTLTSCLTSPDRGVLSVRLIKQLLRYSCLDSSVH